MACEICGHKLIWREGAFSGWVHSHNYAENKRLAEACQALTPTSGRCVCGQEIQYIGSNGASVKCPSCGLVGKVCVGLDDDEVWIEWGNR